MSKKLNIILLAGSNTPAEHLDGVYPVYLTEANGSPVIQSLIESCAQLSPAKIICMFAKGDVSKYHLRNMVSQMHETAIAYPVHQVTEGAACTALLASEMIDNDDELILLNANEILDTDLTKVIAKFRSEVRDAGVVIFKSLHPRYSFVRLTSTDEVVEAAEKNPISSNAIAGMYWFKSGSMFVSAAKDMIRKDAKVNGKFFISPTLNELVLRHKNIGVFRVEPSQYRALKSPAQIQAFETGAAR